MDEKLNLDSEGNPFKMLVFRGSPKSSRKSILHIDEMREEEAAALQNTSNQHYYRRRLPKVLFISMRFSPISFIFYIIILYSAL